SWGSQVDGRFCPKCGASVAADAGTTTGGTIPPPPAAQAAGMQDNVAAALCYILGLLTGVLFLVLAPYNQNRLIRFHAFQSIFLNVAWIAIFIAISIVSLVLMPIPFIGAIFSIVLHMAAGLGVFIIWLMLMYKAYNRERWVLPVIGPMAEKQA